MDVRKYLGGEGGQEALWRDFSWCSREMEQGLDQLERKRTGAYYTAPALAEAMMEALVEEILADGGKPWEMSFLEPCVGTGSFVLAYLRVLHRRRIDREEARQALDRLYWADVNHEALAFFREWLEAFAEVYWGISLEESYFASHGAEGLLLNMEAQRASYVSLREAFAGKNAPDSFDIVVTNPPYKILKAERPHYPTEEAYAADQARYQAAGELARRQFPLASSGVLNLYKLFVEEILLRYIKKGGYGAILIPASVLTEKNGAKLRTCMLTEHQLRSVWVIREESGYLDSRQAACALLLRTGGETESIRITADYCRDPEETVQIEGRDLLKSRTGNAIFPLDRESYQILSALRSFKTVKDYSFIHNLRGELDLTTDKQAVLGEETRYRLLRGRDIGLYAIKEAEPEERSYVDSAFVERSGKRRFVFSERIACQQVVNIHRRRRVTFAYVPAGCVLGNSCNFIAVERNPFGLDLFCLLGLFNTRLINWYFKLLSSNNHVSNYEIDSFPVPAEAAQLGRIGELARRYLQKKDPVWLEEIERLTAQAFQLTEWERDVPYRQGLRALTAVLPFLPEEEAAALFCGDSTLRAALRRHQQEPDAVRLGAAKGILEKYGKLIRGEVLNHVTFKLSDLDLEMIRPVPQGGSWKDIPQKTVEKSKRLLQIQRSGGRTTLYGRIDYSKPSYTITTYFNRPGNGTYIHPVHDRVLSVREAARLQSFPDSYFFCGTRTQLLKQVGNAVPPLLAYQIGRKIVEIAGCQTAIDLFCGAGGLTEGFRAAGVVSLLGNDLEASACATIQANHPRMRVVQGDIRDAAVKAQIIREAQRQHVDLICGGPPCQGFSLAGYRAADDPRNQLFRDFVDVVSAVQPRVIVFENVEGLLSYQRGAVYQDILRLFEELGYCAEGRTLLASHYGVPQRRRRVFIICTRSGLPFGPGDLFPAPITLSADRQVTAREAIGDLEDVPCGEHAMDSGKAENPFLMLVKGRISCQEFCERCQGEQEQKLEIFEEEDGQLSLTD